jgi:hypothetical protein
MAKVKKTATELWLEDMAKQYPSAVEHFVSFLKNWNFPSPGAAFAQLQDSFEIIALYLTSNGAPATVKNIDPIKTCLQHAFMNSESVSRQNAW